MQTTRQYRQTLTDAESMLFGDEPINSSQRWDYYAEAAVFAKMHLEQITARKDEALLSLYTYLGSYAQVAEATGLSRSRVQQIIERTRQA